MADPDTYESDETQASTASTTAGVKFYQIAVPNFLEQAAPAGVPTPTDYVDKDGKTAKDTLPSFSATNTASSFLRLGSSPAPADWSASLFKNSLDLARLVADPIAIAASENMSLATTPPKTLIGNVDDPNSSTLVYSPPPTYYSQGQATTASPPTSVVFQDAFVDGTGPTEGTPFGGGTAFGTAQDPNFLLGFADDTRWRGAPEVSENVYDTTNNLSTNNNVLNPTSTLISNVAVPNVNANRQAETLKLLTKGGWWDHSDGNRVSTTMGDKVEVIQGNYKLVVLGRQPVPAAPPISNTVDIQACLKNGASPSDSSKDLLKQLQGWYDDQSATNLAKVQTAIDAHTWGSGGAPVKPSAADLTEKFAYEVKVWLMTQNSFITDLSGGHFQEQYPSPTPCIKTIEYSLDNNNEWTLYQDNTQGNLITRLKGKTVDLFQGSSRESYVGTKSTTALYASGGATGTTTTDLRLDPMLASYTWAQSVYSQTGSPDKPVGFGPASDNTITVSSGGAGPQPSGVNQGDVVSKTWASRVLSYVGSSASRPVYVYSETNGDQVKSLTSAGNVDSTTNADTKVTSTTSVKATTVYTEINGDGGLGNVINLTKTGSITNLAAAFHYLDMSIGLKTSIVLANMRDIYLGSKSSFTLASATEMFLGQKLSIRIGPSWVYNSSEDMELANSKTSIAAMMLLGI